jgi:hypothetical protein
MRRALQARRPFGLFGTCGYGKTTLLRYVAATAETEVFAQGGVYLQAGQGGLRDLLHRLVGELYTADQPVKLTPDQCAEVLSQVHALVAFDDVTLTRAQADYLQSVLPECSILLSSRYPVLGQDDSHQLTGLPQDAALQMVIDDLGRPLSADEMAGARRLIDAVDGQPLRLRQATALVREDQQSFRGAGNFRSNGMADRDQAQAGTASRAGLSLLPPVPYRGSDREVSGTEFRSSCLVTATCDPGAGTGWHVGAGPRSSPLIKGVSICLQASFRISARRHSTPSSGLWPACRETGQDTDST